MGAQEGGAQSKAGGGQAGGIPAVWSGEGGHTGALRGSLGALSRGCRPGTHHGIVVAVRVGIVVLLVPLVVLLLLQS